MCCIQNVHESIFTELWANDIALLRLEDAVPSGPDVPEIQAVDLPRPGEVDFPADSQECVMKGWGCTANGESNVRKAKNRKKTKTKKNKTQLEKCSDLRM